MYFLLQSFTTKPDIGQPIDSYEGVPVFFNGKVRNVFGRNVTYDGYNLGLKFQCVEFVKRFYYERYGHKMPNSYGHAKDFFDHNVPHGGFNKKRGLYQFENTNYEKPRPGDLLIYGVMPDNPYGHVAIITKVENDKVEYIQQNFGTKTRQTLNLAVYKGIYTIAEYDILGWLRMP